METTVETWQIEELKTKRATYLLNSVATIEPFYGDPLELELFLEDMDAVNELIIGNPIDEVSDRNVRRCFVGRIAKDVLMETGIRASMPWSTIKATLKERYGRAREPAAREALRILRSTRGSHESPAEFGRRIGERTRVLRQKIWDLGHNKESAQVGIKLIEDLVQELVIQQIPERLRNVIRGKATSLEDTLMAIRHEEEDAQRSVMLESESWRFVPPRKMSLKAPPRRVRSPPRGPRERPERRTSTRGPVQEGLRRTDRSRRERPAPRGTRACWQCQEIGHLSRDCPYIYRRDRGDGRPSAGEPMEVNAFVRKEKRRVNRRAGALESATESVGATSDDGSESGREKKPRRQPRRQPRRWETPTKRTSSNEEEVRA
jgi:hypothetical protein